MVNNGWKLPVAVCKAGSRSLYSEDERHRLRRARLNFQRKLWVSWSQATRTSDTIHLTSYNSHNGDWPSGKATGSGPVIGGSNPSSPAIKNHLRAKAQLRMALLDWKRVFYRQVGGSRVSNRWFDVFHQFPQLQIAVRRVEISLTDNRLYYCRSWQ